MIKTKIKIVCNGELVNTYSDRSGGHGGWSNPFEHIPRVGDYIELKHGINGELETYTVGSVLFRGHAQFTGMYENKEIVINVSKIGKNFYPDMFKINEE